eukprot:3470232-Amphidinium_carterae.1
MASSATCYGLGLGTGGSLLRRARPALVAPPLESSRRAHARVDLPWADVLSSKRQAALALWLHILGE